MTARVERRRADEEKRLPLDPLDELRLESLVHLAHAATIMTAAVLTRDELRTRVEELGPGPELERLAATLSPDERELLQDVLLERSGAAGYALRERSRAKGWLRRMWDRADL